MQQLPFVCSPFRKVLETADQHGTSHPPNRATHIRALQHQGILTVSTEEREHEGENIRAILFLLFLCGPCSSAIESSPWYYFLFFEISIAMKFLLAAGAVLAGLQGAAAGICAGSYISVLTPPPYDCAERPQKNNTVTVDYLGYFPNGTVFDQSYNSTDGP